MRRLSGGAGRSPDAGPGSVFVARRAGEEAGKGSPWEMGVLLI